MFPQVFIGWMENYFKHYLLFIDILYATLLQSVISDYDGTIV